MVFFINETDVIGQILQAGSQNVTGSLFLTLLIILIFLMVIAMMFSIPLEFISILILPICLASASYYGDFIAPVGIIIFYISFIITRNWIFK